jgi:hypothetical protein
VVSAGGQRQYRDDPDQVLHIIILIFATQVTKFILSQFHANGILIPQTSDKKYSDDFSRYRRPGQFRFERPGEPGQRPRDDYFEKQYPPVRLLLDLPRYTPGPVLCNAPTVRVKRH